MPLKKMKNKVGRPKTGIKKGFEVAFYVDENEHKFIKEKALDMGVSASNLIRFYLKDSKLWEGYNKGK